MRAHWVLHALLIPAVAGAQSPRPAPTPTEPDSAAATLPAHGAFAPAQHATLTTAPGGRTIASLDSSARVQILAHDRGWTRVRVEGWVRDGDLRLADTSQYSQMSAADLRADPQGSRGKLVRWHVQVIALQTADPLRRDMAPNEPYLLARGPEHEDALLYLALPPSLLGTARTLEPLSWVTVVARVRVGRSDPAGVPILDVQRIASR
ncbi:MAG TPA: hypothetical protein VFW98_02885 [Gemmatimonadaceae bacterium]|nr:hypothetical protein [Gemmatimonadaceae bacterium]